VLLDDFVGDEQAQAAALAHGLGGEEGIEYPGQQFCRDTRAGVRQDQVDNRRAGTALAQVGGKAVVPIAGVGGAGGNREHAGLPHGVVGVDDEVEQHLLQAWPVAPHGQFRRDVHAHFNAGRPLALEEAQGFLNQLGEDIDAETLRDIKVNPGLPTSRHVVAMRFDGQLYFANVSYFEDTVLGALADHPEARYFLVVGDGINQLDASGEEVIHHLATRLKENGVTLVFSGLKKQVLDVMRATGLFELITQANLFATEDLAIAAIYERLGETAKDDLFCALKPALA